MVEMLILNEQGEAVVDPDLDMGHLCVEEMMVFHSYVIDVYEEGHWEEIDYCPETDGRLVEWAVDVPEEGHWETKDEDGNLITNFDKPIPDDWPHEQTISDIWQFLRYKLYTEEELAEIAERKRLAEEEAIKAAEREAYLEEAPIVQEEILEGLIEVSDLAAENAVTTEELMDAIVELADIVAASANV